MDDNPEIHLQNTCDVKINKFSLPLVSVIIVNYNYGRFLREAVDSVFAQNYPNIESIVVDNASTDESNVVLLNVARKHLSVIILQRLQNDGQCTAAIEGFEASSGDYVVFLDADDVLLRTFVETHVFVHLSLRIPIGFSSSDVVQTVDSRMVLANYFYLSEFVRSAKGKTPDLFRRFDASCPEFWPLQNLDATIESQVHLVEPLKVGDWVWSPTSGNCFRRDALVLFMNNAALGNLRYAMDTYLSRGISVLMGSVVIDRPLSIYRIHGSNIFSKHPHLYGILNYDRGGPNHQDQCSREVLIDHLIANAKLFLRKLHCPHLYMNALKALDDVWPRLPSPVPGCRSYLAGRVVTEAATLTPALGFSNFIVLLRRLKVAPHIILKAWLGRKTAKRS